MQALVTCIQPCGCEFLNSIRIPCSVTRIGDGAFERCVSLNSVQIAAGVEEIGNGAFDGCLSLTSVEIPISVTKIGDEVVAAPLPTDRN